MCAWAAMPTRDRPDQRASGRPHEHTRGDLRAVCSACQALDGGFFTEETAKASETNPATRAVPQRTTTGFTVYARAQCKKVAPAHASGSHPFSHSTDE